MKRKVMILLAILSLALALSACDGNDNIPPDVYIQTAEAQRANWKNNLATLNAYTPQPGTNQAGETPTPGAPVPGDYAMGIK